MSETASADSGATGAVDAGKGSAAGSKAAGKGNKGPGFFGSIALFVRQVIAELKKVVTPTRSQLINYSIVVVVFVAVIMLFVVGIDFGLGKLASLIFG
ncbi:preprotein translocase subunit SecE [Rarobacter incanus]|uniref:Protein translocase subunit SecE n=1 Tax=Rarobacter incanus TaxID=153494 RepID=A0A542SQY5_9MICO|nr:preprotein translocase subunit SecE [Rarobacter incanus]TQK77022.1 preprotein translocase subunit SecE [Rarobacter incanus]